ncbi:endonuclease/exonuclease/phosphatase family protein [Paracoccus sp. p4-l81]|uniref:endonuclease/exonuclease/phosphatase family protein n=1 Tax=Paracoccus sp. p4-l81 TaxID=3342806 RepID=UPI0035BAA709
MRLVSWNIAWFDSLFDSEGRLRADDGPGGLPGVAARDQIAAIAKVLRHLDADGVMVIEAPDTRLDGGTISRDTRHLLGRFARAHGLRARRAVRGFLNGTQQEIAFLHDARVLRARHDPQGRRDPTARAPRFDGDYQPDPARLVPEIGQPGRIRFSKPPLELALTTARGMRLRLIGAHVKSKAPHGATSAEDALRRAARNGRLQLAQALWLRARIDALLRQNQPLIVMGDLNDGPGHDRVEAALGLSTVEVVMGADGPASLRLHDPHAEAARQGRHPAPVSARFHRPDLSDAPDGMFAALLDYILISPDLARHRPHWQILDPDMQTDPALAQALRLASDHYPVVLDIDL